MPLTELVRKNLEEYNTEQRLFLLLNIKSTYRIVGNFISEAFEIRNNYQRR